MNQKIILFSIFAFAILLAGCTQGSGNTNPNNANPAGGGTPAAGSDAELSACAADDIIETQGWCYIRLAQSRDDPFICERIGDDDHKNQCYSAFAFDRNDSSFCAKMNNPGDYQNMCYLGLAESKRDYSLCGLMTAGSVKDQCIDNALSYTKDPKYCDALTDPAEKQRCIGDIEAERTGTENPDNCALVGNSATRDICYSSVASANQDISICNNVQNAQTKESCQGGVAVAKKDQALCDGIQDTTLKDMCYQQVAFAKNDPAICEKLSLPPELIESCKLSVVSANQ